MALRRARAISALIAAAALAPAQKVISAKSGLVYYVQGRVSVEGSSPLPFGDTLRQLQSGETLASERGRAEVLLNPGTVLRLGNMTRIRMDDIKITYPCVTILSGSAVITVRYLLKPDQVEVHAGTSTIILDRPGEYRFDAGASPNLRVFQGRAAVTSAVESVPKLRRGQSIDLGDLSIAKFDAKKTDSLERWAQLRSNPPQRWGLRPVPPPLGLEPRSQQSSQPGGFTNSAAIPPPSR